MIFYLSGYLYDLYMIFIYVLLLIPIPIGAGGPCRRGSLQPGSSPRVVAMQCFRPIGMPWRGRKIQVSPVTSLRLRCLRCLRCSNRYCAEDVGQRQVGQ